ncbi:type IV pilus biogenesis protein PilM [Pseudomonas sp. 5P_5.1_Bac1]|uniref:type IV pilus biogenesis protein PilM n=1 Tax=Pseudomonas sp. 5P_5.1_Bac1 TaxID=2971616 RepID=UPI0021C8EB2C|nr:pilus assembly protein PilM [Pseudomonas sp. 5P_5.1_Bac1]MCU1721976.1 pilus assembly protein PilM [Pseudomonas sp. 5P_5.1_Bac1]
MFGRSGWDAGSLLGVEIASCAVRVLQLERREEGLRVRGWAVEPLSRGAVVDGRVIDHEAVAVALMRAFARSGASRREVALSVPASVVIQHAVAMPSELDDDEIDERLRDEAEQFIPFAVEEAALDYQVSAGAPGFLSVAFTACRQEWLDGMEAVMDLAGLRARIVDIDSHAWQRVLNRQPTGLAAVLQLEADGWVFQAFTKEGTPSFSERHVPLEPQLERLVEFVDLCLLREPGAMPDQLWLAGARADWDGLAGQLRQRLGVVTQPFDPLATLLEPQQGAADLRQAAPMLGVACGLALRGYA